MPNTGVQSFTDPSSLGPLYPFAGGEVILVIIGVLLWIVWHVLDIRGESKEFKQAAELYRRVGLERAMHNGGTGDLPSEEQVKIDEVNKAIHELHEGGEYSEVLQRINRERSGGEVDQDSSSSG